MANFAYANFRELREGEVRLRVLSVSYVCRAMIFDTLHKTACCIGPGRRRTSQNLPSTHFGE